MEVVVGLTVVVVDVGGATVAVMGKKHSGLQHYSMLTC